MFIVARATDNKTGNNKTDDFTSLDTYKLSNKFRGVFSKEVGKDFMKHTKFMREEWDGI